MFIYAFTKLRLLIPGESLLRILWRLHQTDKFNYVNIYYNFLKLKLSSILSCLKTPKSVTTHYNGCFLPAINGQSLAPTSLKICATCFTYKEQCMYLHCGFIFTMITVPFRARWRITNK